MPMAWRWPALIGAAALLFGISVMAGRVWSPPDVWFNQGDPRWAIVLELRLPRTILAVVIGAALGLCGAAMQGYTRNPLADPGVLGVSAMAAFGAVMALYFGLTAVTPWILPVLAITGAITGVLFLIALSGVTTSSTTFVLAGVVLQTIAGAAVTLALSLAPNPWATQEIVDWMIGSIADRSFEDVRLALPFVLVGTVVLLSLGRALDALSLGEQSAASLGVDLRRTQVLIALGVGLASGACVAVSGVISFVGLIVPHILRPWVGGSPRALLIPSMIGGAALVLAADIVVRLTPAASEIRLGVALSAIGGPFFLAMLISMSRKLA